MPSPPSSSSRRSSRKKKSVKGLRPVLYQLCRAGERFEVGDGPVDLTEREAMTLGRGDPHRTRHSKFFVDDPWMSSRHAEVRADPERSTEGHPAFVIEDVGSTNGVVLNGNIIERASLESGDIIETGRTFWLFALEPETLPMPEAPMEFGTWATWNPRLARDLRRLEDNASSARHVLISGQDGSGKGFLARTTHLLSGRAGRLVHLDCRERSPKRLVVDLFGSKRVKGARFKEADLGTLFLEHIDALPLALQDRVVETLTSGGFVPEGRSKRVKCDVRIIASTTRLPKKLLKRGKLSPAFYETVGGIKIDLPSVDERRTDFGLLLDDFLARARGAPALSRDACRAVLLHKWTRNVKALARVIECAAVLAHSEEEGGGRVDLDHLPVSVVGKETLLEVWSDPEASAEGPPPVSAGTGRVKPRPEGRAAVPPPIPVESPMASPFDPSLGPPVHNASPPARHDFEDDDDTTNVVNINDHLRRSEVFTHDGGGADAPLPYSELAAGFETGDPMHWPPRPPTRPSSGVRPLDENTAREPPRSALRPPTLGIERRDNKGPESGEGRPPSAFHDMVNIERSYASAVDPDLIVDALRRSRGNVSAAARYLGKPRTLVLRWIKEFQLQPDDYRNG